MKRPVGVIGVVVISAHLTTALSILSARAAEAYRKGRWEFILSPQYTLSKNLGFDGGTTAKINDTFGFGFQIGYNLSNHWNLAGRRPTGRWYPWTSPLDQRDGSNQHVRLCGYLQLSRRPPDAIRGRECVGGAYVNTDIAEGPPVTGCFWDPWYGSICGLVQPTKSDTFLTYAVGGGLRWDVNRYFFLRGAMRQQWIDLSYTGTPGFTTFKLDFSFKF